MAKTNLSLCPSGRCLDSGRETVQSAAAAEVEPGFIRYQVSDRFACVLGSSGSSGSGNMHLPTAEGSLSGLEASTSQREDKDEALFIPFGDESEEEPVEGSNGGSPAVRVPRHVKRLNGCDRFVLFNAGEQSTPEVWSVLRESLPKELFNGVVSIQKVHQKHNSVTRYDIYIEKALSAGFRRNLYASTRRKYQGKSATYVVNKELDVRTCESVRSKLHLGKYSKWRVDVFKPWRDRNFTLGPSVKCPAIWDVINIATVNINGFRTKMGELNNFIYTEQVSICAVQESLVRDHSYNVQINGFATFSRPCKEGFRGQAVLIHNSLAAYEVGERNDYYIHLKVNGIKTAKGAVHVFAVYLPSGSVYSAARRKLMKEIRKTYLKAANESACIILGDFNMPAEELNKQLKAGKTGLSVMKTKGSALSRFPKHGWCNDLDHIVANDKAMALVRPPRVYRKYEISDHRPVMASFRYQPIVERAPAVTRKLDPTALKSQAKEFVNHNKWQVLSEMEVEDIQGLNNMTTKMADTLAEITFDLGIKKTASNGPPKLPKVMKKVLKAKNSVAARIAERFAKGNPPCEAQMKKLEDLKERFDLLHKKWTKLMKSHEITQMCQEVRGHQMKKVWTRIKNKIGNQVSNRMANPVRNKAGELCVTQEEILKAVTEHYDHLVNGDPGTSQDAEYWGQVEMDKSMGQPKEELTELNDEITWREVLLAVRRMKRGTAAGNDELHVEMLKEMLNQECREQVMAKSGKAAVLDNVEYALKESLLPEEPLTWFGKVLFQIIGKTWELEKCADIWDEVTLCNLFKSGDPELLVNYRGISLISVGLKTLLSIVADRLYTNLEGREFFSKWQSGFRRKEEAVAQFIAIAEVIRRRGNDKTHTYAVFIDFKKAFDKVHHEALYRILDHIGVRGKALGFIKSLYRNAKIRVRSGGMLSDSFGMARGNRQGCPMSPLLFDIFVNFLLEETNPRGVGLLEDQCLGGQFADDLVALCKTGKQVQQFLDKLTNWCNKWGMEIGPQKSGVMFFGNSSERQVYEQMDFKAGEDSIPKVKEYKYLGIIMGEDMIDSRAPGGSEEQHAKLQARKGLKKMWAMRPLLKDQAIPLTIRIDLIKTFIIPYMTYGSEWVGYKGGNAEPQQRIINKAMKIAMGVSSNSSLHESFTLAYELGIPQMEVIQNGLRTRLCQKVKSGQLKTHLDTLQRDWPMGRKWTWISTNNNWKAKYGKVTTALPLWYYKGQSYETHIRSNNYSWPLISDIMNAYKGRFEEGYISGNEEDRETLVKQLLQPEDPTEVLLQYDLQIIEKGGKTDAETSLAIQQIKDATLSRQMNSNRTQAWEHYNKWNFGATRGYIKTAIAFPWLSKGTTWLARIRTKGYPRVDMQWNKITAMGGTPHFGKDECPLCQTKIKPGEEWIHLLVDCQHPEVLESRRMHLEEPLEYITQELQESYIVCEEEPERSSPNEFGEVGLKTAQAVCLIGGTVNDWFESKYHLGYGQLDNGVMGLRTYGFIYAAEFLREVMPLYLDVIYNGMKSEYRPTEVLTAEVDDEVITFDDSVDMAYLEDE